MTHNLICRRNLVLLLAVSLLAGCSGIRPYPDTADKNMLIRTETKSGSIFSKVRAAVHIYRVDANCQIEYEGTVKLDQPSVPVGIPANRPSYLVFDFSSSSFLANSRSTISYETLFKPRAGHSYDAKVSYKDDIYNVEIRETNSRKSSGRVIDRQDLSACSALARSE